MDADDIKKRAKNMTGGSGDDTAWNVAVTGSVILAGMAARKLLGAGWRQFQGEEPPKNPASSSTGWGEALAWTAAAGAAVGVARMLARRGAAAGWKKATGDSPV